MWRWDRSVPARTSGPRAGPARMNCKTERIISMLAKRQDTLVRHCSNNRGLSQRRCLGRAVSFTYTKYVIYHPAAEQSDNWYKASPLLAAVKPRWRSTLCRPPWLWKIYCQCSHFQLLYLLYCTIVHKERHINTVILQGLNFLFFLPVRWTFCIYLHCHFILPSIKFLFLRFWSAFLCGVTEMKNRANVEV